MKTDMNTPQIDEALLMGALRPEILTTLRGCAAALREAGKDFALSSPRATRPNLYELHAEKAERLVDAFASETDRLKFKAQGLSVS